jgi:hypothetical protein
MTVASDPVASFPLSPFARTRNDTNGDPMTVEDPYLTSVSLVAYDDTIVSETYSVVSAVVEAKEAAEYGLTSRVSVMLWVPVPLTQYHSVNENPEGTSTQADPFTEE